MDGGRDTEAIVCWRVEDLARPSGMAVRSECSRCLCAVWVQARNLRHGIPLVCRQCSLLLAAKAMATDGLVVVQSAAVLDKPTRK